MGEAAECSEERVRTEDATGMPLCHFEYSNLIGQIDNTVETVFFSLRFILIGFSYCFRILIM